MLHDDVAPQVLTYTIQLAGDIATLTATIINDIATRIATVLGVSRSSVLVTTAAKEAMKEVSA